MTEQGRLTRPGGLLHLSFIGSVVMYLLVVVGMRGATWEWTVEPGVGLLLHFVFGVAGLGTLLGAFFLLQRPHFLPSVRTTFLFIYILLDAIGVYGVVLFILTRDVLSFYAFVLLSFSSLILLWTQGGRWDQLVAQEERDLGRGV